MNPVPANRFGASRRVLIVGIAAILLACGQTAGRADNLLDNLSSPLGFALSIGNPFGGAFSFGASDDGSTWVTSPNRPRIRIEGTPEGIRLDSITPDTTTPTAGSPVTFTLVFNRGVENFDSLDDLTATTTDVLLLGIGAINTTDNITFTVPVFAHPDAGQESGSYTLELKLPSNVTGLFSGPPAEATATSASVTVLKDPAPPTVLRLTPAATTLASGAQTSFRLVFSKPMQNVDVSDLIFSASTSVLGGTATNFATINAGRYSFDTTSATIVDGASSGSFTYSVDLFSDINDLDGNALGATLTSPVVTVNATAYQVWAFDKGLPAGEGSGKFDDPNDNGLINWGEYIHDFDPLAASNPGRFRLYAAPLPTDRFFTVTLPVLDGTTYTSITGGRLRAAIPFDNNGVIELIAPSINLTDFTAAPVTVEEVVPAISGSVPGLPDLDPLPAGWSYRTFRITSPISTSGGGFLRFEVFDDSGGS